MNILVTGGAGFIGSNLVDKLSLEHNIIVMDNLSTGNLNNINSKCKFYCQDIRDNLDNIFMQQKIDVIFHLAAFINLRDSITNPKLCFDINVQGSINLIDYAKKYNVKKIIFSSTGGAIYSEFEKLPWNENTLAEPKSPYGLSKLVIEQYLEMSGINYSILRYSNVYGPKQNSKGEAGVISIFIDKIKNKETLNVFGSGNQTRDFVYVDDVVQSNILCLNNCDKQVLNVSTNTETSVNDLIKLLNYNKVNYLNAIEQEVEKTKLDNIKLMSFGWKPTINICDGLKLTSDWFNK